MAAVTTRTHCPYCSLQCGMLISVDGDAVSVAPDAAFPVNRGGLCIKGWTSTKLLRHPERLTTPLVRNAAGELVPATLDEALDRVAAAFTATQQRYGKDAVGVFGGGSLTNEKAYLLGKFARVALGTSQIDYNGRFCMSSAAAAGNRAFGIDRGLPFPLDDLSGADVILLVGSNVAETMPPVMQYFEAQRERGGRLIVADPRQTPTAKTATLHLPLAPGTDAALANGLLHLLVREGSIDLDYIRNRTTGWEAVRSAVAGYWPERVERITGVPQASLERAARMLGSARTAMILTARGAEQQSQGVNNVLAFINIALALGLQGRPYSGYGCLTGQGNGQGGREHGQKADQLPGYRSISDPAARAYVAGVWGIDEADLPGPGISAYELLAKCGAEGGVRALYVLGSNVVVSAPDTLAVEERLKALDFLVVADLFLSETAALADVVLPGAQWAEEEGTMTNLEGRVVRRRQAVCPPEGVVSDAEVLCRLAARLGRGQFFPLAEPHAIFQELRRASAGGIADYSGISYDSVDLQQGVFWPCTESGSPGTPRLFAERFPTADGRARFVAVQHRASAEEPDDEYPLFLTTGRVMAHYQSGTQTRRVEDLMAFAPEPVAELHPLTARRWGVVSGGPVSLITRRGRMTCKAKVSAGIREDTVFVPFHWGNELAINRLTNPALDPVSRMPEFKVCAVRVEACAPNGGRS